MPPELVKLPASLVIGKTGNKDLAYDFGSLTSERIKAFGFNMDFAPVLDIFSNPKNTVIGNRAFGTDAETVTSFGLMSMEGIASGGVIPVVKHFQAMGIHLWIRT
jgi:beta-N-acetylhexosaminidase